MNAGKILLAVLAGLAAGALIGILFAPEKGIDTRKKITKKGDDYMDSIRDKFEEILSSIKDKYEKGKEEVNEMIHNGAAHAKQAEKEVRSVNS